jgi:hypothetical protein
MLRDAIEIGSGFGANGVLQGTYSGGSSTGEHYYGAMKHDGWLIDEPSTTSLITYKLQAKVNSGVGYVGRNITDTNPYAYRTASGIILMEVLQ